jgi:hypothetical protein
MPINPELAISKLCRTYSIKLVTFILRPVPIQKLSFADPQKLLCAIIVDMPECIELYPFKIVTNMKKLFFIGLYRRYRRI